MQLLAGLVTLGIILYIITIAGTWSNFKNIPYHLQGKENGKDTQISYSRVRMTFKQWKRLFELDPNSFFFIVKNGCKIDPKVLKGSFEESHPTYCIKEKDQLYLVDFDFINWLFYQFYCRKILYKLSDKRQLEMSEAIVGDIQSKIDAIVAESEKHIQDTLALQKKILERMPQSPENQTLEMH